MKSKSVLFGLAVSLFLTLASAGSEAVRGVKAPKSGSSNSVPNTVTNDLVTEIARARYTTNIYPRDISFTPPIRANSALEYAYLVCMDDGDFYTERSGQGNWREGRDIYTFPRLVSWGSPSSKDGLSLSIVNTYATCDGGMTREDWAGTLSLSSGAEALSRAIGRLFE